MPGIALERHFTLTEIAELWNLSYGFVRAIFAEEEGVLKVGEGTRLSGRGKYKRRYFTIRVPESVLLRVQQRLVHKRAPGPSAPLSRRGSSHRSPVGALEAS
jgi:hypothetical protein